MARKLRLEFSGACYHVINRGNYRRDLFETEGAARSFERCLGEAATRYGWLVHAYVIMRNHFHLAVETPEPNLSDGMKWLQGTWARRFNDFRDETGRPFQGRYRAQHVEPGHALAQVAHYIHLNPVRAKIVPPERVGEHRWSSLYWFPRRDRPDWLVASTVLHESGGWPDSRAGWQHYAAFLAVWVEEDPSARGEGFARLSQAWSRGSTAFRAEVRHEITGRTERAGRFALLGADREAVRAAREELWEERLRELAHGLGIVLTRLPPTPSAIEKLRLADGLKQQTSAPNGWITQRLQMGSASGLASRLHRFRRARGERREPCPMS